MDDRQKKAFDFASDLTKQVMGLSSGIIAFTVTFNKEIFKLDPTPKAAIWVLTAAWMCYLISIFFGVVTLMAMTGQLEPVPAAITAAEPGADEPAPRITSPTVRLGSAIQLIAFLAATVCIFIFGFISVWNK